MALSIDPTVIDTLLLGRGDRRRQLQDLPVLGDVWTDIALRPDTMHDLLITPHHDFSAVRVARVLAKITRNAPTGKEGRMISYLTGLVAARLNLEDVWSAILPMTSWWQSTISSLGNSNPDKNLCDQIAQDFELEKRREDLAASGSVPTDDEARQLNADEAAVERRPLAERQQIRLGVLIGVLTAARDEVPPETINHPLKLAALPFSAADVGQRGAHAISEAWYNYRKLVKLEGEWGGTNCGTIWSVATNRRADYATDRSVPAIKADAARQLFSIDCSDIGWAVLDSGIDTNQDAFLDLKKMPVRSSRVAATYDFGDIRAILNSGNGFDNNARSNLAIKLLEAQQAEVDLASTRAERIARIETTLKTLADAINQELPVDWKLVEPLVKRSQPLPPEHPHGTHVAGILGGCWEDPNTPAGAPRKFKQLGVCPDIKLYDFRVLGPDAEQTEFAVIAALQFIGFLNRRNAYRVIDGINMSLAIAHNVRNYACGQTPVCVEAEARVAEGIVVVAAAGNRGYQGYRLADGSSFESYAASSITDPGNAEGVITVGATHRFWPHTYGVSFFSSRGPTGDGRQKPDLLAPGERIMSVVPGPPPTVDAKDGTSMAAPMRRGGSEFWDLS